MSGKRPFGIPFAFFAAFLLAAPSLCLSHNDFDAWLQDFREEANNAGISAETLQAHLAGIEPIQRVIELDRRQAPKPDRKKAVRPDLQRYLQRVVPASRIETARERFAEHRMLLEEIGRRFDVDQGFVVALWAIESDFGRRMGSFPLVPALATLAHEGRRGDFFRSELLTILRLLDEGIVQRSTLHGSWAGAMGQVQFMPSSLRSFAVDYDGSGGVDIWESTPDALASAANYLALAGWRRAEPWGQKVSLPQEFAAESDPNRLLTLEQWRSMGLTIDGPAARKAAFILPEGEGGSAYLVFNNFRVLRKWNRSNFFALAVCRLAAAIDTN